MFISYDDTEGKNLPNDWSERDAPLQSFGVEQDSLKEYDGVVNTKWWSVRKIEEHGWRNGHEKKPNENCGRDKTVIWWVELVILHMLLLNDVQKIVMVPQIHYIAVCDATTNSPKLQECLDTADMCSKSMEWSMFLSWCRSSFSPFKTKKTFCFSLFCSVYCLAVSKNDTLRKLWNTFLVFVDKNVFCVCSLLLKSLLWVCNCLLKFSLTGTNFYRKAFWCSFFTKELDVHLLRNTIFLILFYFFWWSFIDSCLFYGCNDTDIGRGSSVASSRLMSFLVMSFHCFSVFSSFFLWSCVFRFLLFYVLPYSFLISCFALLCIS